MLENRNEVKETGSLAIQCGDYKMLVLSNCLGQMVEGRENHVKFRLKKCQQCLLASLEFGQLRNYQNFETR